VLEVDGDHLYEYDSQLYRQLENYPTDIIPIFDLVATGIFKENLVQWGYNVDDFDNSIIQVRPFNLRTTHQMRSLDPSHIDKLISIKGIVIRCSDVIPEMKEASFRCYKCFWEHNEFIHRGKIIEPDICGKC
jgi:DNA replication licensing factor MCM4